MASAVAKRKGATYRCSICGHSKGGFQSMPKARRALEIHKGHKHPDSQVVWHRAGHRRYEGFDGDMLVGEIQAVENGWEAIPNVEVSPEDVVRVIPTKAGAQRHVEQVYGRVSLVMLRS